MRVAPCARTLFSLPPFSSGSQSLEERKRPGLFRRCLAITRVDWHLRRLVRASSSRHVHSSAFAQMGLADQGAMILGLDVLACPSTEVDRDGGGGKLVLSAGGRRLWVCA
jgi:hypothetical protein